MADLPKPEAGDSAEKAYAAAAETVDAKPVADTPVEFPSKAKRAPKPRAADPAPAAVTPAPIPPAPLPVAAKAPRKPQPPKLPVAKAPLAKARPVAKPAVPAPRKFTPITKPAIAKPTAAPITKPEISQLKEEPMNAQTNDFTTKDFTADKFAGIKDVLSDVKTKAKAAFDKGASSIGDATEFAKGNVEAFVESGKIYTAGLQELGSTYVAESKTAFETMQADAKDLAAQKTPTDFFKLQSELAKKNFESAVAFGTKSSEAWLKLAGDAFAPISGRVSLAVEKVKTAA